MDGVKWEIEKKWILFKFIQDFNRFIREAVGEILALGSILQIRVFIWAKVRGWCPPGITGNINICLLYTSDAADE